jgi:hypothetical protein
LNVFLVSDENELPAIYVIRFKPNAISGRRLPTARAEGKETLADVAAVYARVSLREAQQAPLGALPLLGRQLLRAPAIRDAPSVPDKFTTNSFVLSFIKKFRSF